MQAVDGLSGSAGLLDCPPGPHLLPVFHLLFLVGPPWLGQLPNLLHTSAPSTIDDAFQSAFFLLLQWSLPSSACSCQEDTEFLYSSKKQDSLQQSKQEETGLPHTQITVPQLCNSQSTVLSLMPTCLTHSHSLNQTTLPTVSVNTAISTPRTFSFQAAVEEGETQAESAGLCD